jgi:ABC-type transport system involved in cytochrome bd biosynthesis fused ATPase/permease subunit
MSQHNVLIDDSLSNSLFLDEKFDDNLIKNAKKYLIKFKLKKLIKLLNKKYDGEYSLGGMLSGGEKQRISIIRTILLGGELLFFDEPTSSLDKTNEDIVMKEFQEIKKNKIIIISTHKKDLKSHFDKIINI